MLTLGPLVCVRVLFLCVFVLCALCLSCSVCGNNANKPLLVLTLNNICTHDYFFCNVLSPIVSESCYCQ